MAKKRRRRKRQGLVSKLTNAALIALSLARPLSILLTRGFDKGAIDQIINEATFGLVQPGGALGTFDLGKGLSMYGPAGAALAVGKLKSFAMRHFPVRG